MSAEKTESVYEARARTMDMSMLRSIESEEKESSATEKEIIAASASAARVVGNIISLLLAALVVVGPNYLLHGKGEGDLTAIERMAIKEVTPLMLEESNAGDCLAAAGAWQGEIAVSVVMESLIAGLSHASGMVIPAIGFCIGALSLVGLMVSPVMMIVRPRMFGGTEMTLMTAGAAIGIFFVRNALAPAEKLCGYLGIG